MSSALSLWLPLPLPLPLLLLLAKTGGMVKSGLVPEMVMAFLGLTWSRAVLDTGPGEVGAEWTAGGSSSGRGGMRAAAGMTGLALALSGVFSCRAEVRRSWSAEPPALP
jgi:hypothetical protein